MPLLLVTMFSGGCSLAGAAPPRAPAPSPDTTELAMHAGVVCPRRLPITSDPSGNGFGVTQVADTLPSLLSPERAWVCQYRAVEAGRLANGVRLAWVRHGGPRTVDPGRLPTVAGQLRDLTLSDDDQSCSTELGPRWLLVYSHQGDLTGVEVDSYGCHDVRLTSDPFDVPIGDASYAGMVHGTLTAPAALLTELVADWDR